MFFFDRSPESALNFTIACAKTFDYPVPAMTLIYHLNTDRSCSISLTSDKHEARIAAGHPKSKFYRCNYLFISEMKNNRKKVTKTGGMRFEHPEFKQSLIISWKFMIAYS